MCDVMHINAIIYVSYTFLAERLATIIRICEKAITIILQYLLSYFYFFIYILYIDKCVYLRVSRVPRKLKL